MGCYNVEDRQRGPSPDEFRDRLLDLINETDGASTSRAFERNIGGGYRSGANWYFDAMIVYEPEVAQPGRYGPKTPYVSLTIDLPSYAFGDWREGQCLVAGSMSKRLRGEWGYRLGVGDGDV